MISPQRCKWVCKLERWETVRIEIENRLVRIMNEGNMDGNWANDWMWNAGGYSRLRGRCIPSRSHHRFDSCLNNLRCKWHVRSIAVDCPGRRHGYGKRYDMLAILNQYKLLYHQDISKNERGWSKSTIFFHQFLLIVSNIRTGPLICSIRVSMTTAVYRSIRQSNQSMLDRRKMLCSAWMIVRRERRTSLRYELLTRLRKSAAFPISLPSMFRLQFNSSSMPTIKCFNSQSHQATASLMESELFPSSLWLWQSCSLLWRLFRNPVDSTQVSPQFNIDIRVKYAWLKYSYQMKAKIWGNKSRLSEKDSVDLYSLRAT